MTRTIQIKTFSLYISLWRKCPGISPFIRETGKNLNQSDKPKTSMNFITSPMNSSYFTDKWTPRSPNPNTRKPSNFKNENMKRGKKNNNTCFRDTTVFLHTKLPLFPPRHSESLFNNTTKRTKNNFLSDRPINEKKKKTLVQ